MTLNCIIVDDEPGARKLLEEYVADIEFLRLAGKAENPLKANSLLKEAEIHLLFLDINMPKISGMEFLRSLPSPPPTILTTAYTEYAIEGFELDVLDYLVKPFSFDRFLKACNKAMDYWAVRAKGGESRSPADHFFVKCDGRIEKVLFDELVYVEARLNYVILHTETRNLMVYLTIKGMAEQLPADRFLRIHKSTLVNTGKITSIEGNTLHAGGSVLLISQGLQEDVLKQIVKDRMIKR